MNKELLAERKKFKESFMAVHSSSSSSKRSSEASGSLSQKKPEKKASSSSAQDKLNLAQIKQMGGGSQFKFGVLTKIVRHMKTRHLEGKLFLVLANNTIVVQSFLRISGEDQPLTLSEILDETHQLDTDSKTKYWLENEALRNNPKISASMMRQGGETTYMYKPPFQIMNKKALLKLLKQYSIKGTYFILGFVIKALFFFIISTPNFFSLLGRGGILLEELQESLPNCDKIIRILEDKGDIWLVNRPADKKKIVFYHDNSDDFEVEDDFVKLWRSVTVDGKDDINIEEYLNQQKITVMQGQGMRKVALKRKPIKRNNRRKRQLKDNLHIAADLEDYSEMTTQAYKK